MKRVGCVVSLVMTGLLLTAPPPQAGWAGEAQKVVVQVDGLSCPFCGFGLEKKLKRIEGVREVTLFIDKGVAELKVVEGKTVTEAQVRKAVEKAGFTARAIEFSGGGR